MIELISRNQLNIMLALCGACGILAVLLSLTRFLSLSRKRILIFMELTALFLLWFDREAYIYSGNPGHKAYVMVRVSNFMVFFMTSAIVFGFNLYLKDLLANAKRGKIVSRRLAVIGYVSVIGMLLAVVSSLTGLYYYFDEHNVYHRGQGFLIAYVIPVICPLVQYTVIRQYKKVFSKLIYISLNLYIFVPIICGIIQIFAYGVSIVNMAMVAVSISLYMFTYLDINDTVNHAHEIELANMEGEKLHMQRLFDQTATAFVSAVEKKDDFTNGKSVKVAEYARKIARLCGKDDNDCEKAYYTALLHDVGLIGIPDKVIKNEANPAQFDYEAYRKKPIIGKEILSNITEYPYLSIGAYYSHERYNGTGYPEGLKGEDIPEIARLVAVADAYVTMITRKRYREARPDFVAREAFIKGAGVEFDPQFADAMVKIIDAESKDRVQDDISIVEKELTCKKYRDHVSVGIPVTSRITNISFDCDLDEKVPGGFSAPSIIIFDSYDRRIHDNEKAITAYKYEEFGEIWFDDHSISTAARNMVEKPIESDPSLEGYEIVAAKYDDHMRLTMTGPKYAKEVIVAFQDGSTSVYIGLTGENCKIRNININQTEEVVHAGDIPRISDEISYVDHFESDVKNVQINQTRSASTEGLEIKNKLRLVFHNTSLPVATFVWHCPYVVLYYSEDGQIGGEGYLEYALIKLNGEKEGDDSYAENNFTMKRKDKFPGWDVWKELNKAGLEYEVLFEKRGNSVVTTTETLGISIQNTTVIKEDKGKVYVALTGDRCALTDIRIL